ncbi:uncharacterized protein TNCV_988691 [Trichonephila clavipes]|nr:uncharacterized protein TNCV_988691 [Trichonephila clavipes]
MNVWMYDLASHQRGSTDLYENQHEYVFFGREGFCAVLIVAAPNQVALQHINFCTVQSIAKLPTASLKRIPTLHYSQHVSIE